MAASTIMSGGHVMAFSTDAICVESLPLVVETATHQTDATDAPKTHAIDEDQKSLVCSIVCDLPAPLPATNFADLTGSDLGVHSPLQASVPGGEWLLLRPPKTLKPA